MFVYVRHMQISNAENTSFEGNCKNLIFCIMDEKVIRIQINFPHSDANVNIVSCFFF